MREMIELGFCPDFRCFMNVVEIITHLGKRRSHYPRSNEKEKCELVNDPMICVSFLSNVLNQWWHGCCYFLLNSPYLLTGDHFCTIIFQQVGELSVSAAFLDNKNASSHLCFYSTLLPCFILAFLTEVRCAWITWWRKGDSLILDE